mgnify:CR=1 FL=1
MEWDVEVKRMLRDYKYKQHSIGNLPKEIASLEDDLQSIRSATSDATPVKGGGNAREDRMLNNRCRIAHNPHRFSFSVFL